jgi:SAM-dependent methyltransferase
MQHAATGGRAVSDWQRARVAPERTHHLVDGEPLYAARFDEVLAFHAPGLAPVRRGEVAWHIEGRGEPAYARRFQRTFGFYEERAAVTGEEGWHHILPSGGDLYPERYAWCGNYQDGRCAVRDREGLYGHLDPAGRPVHAARFRYAGDYRDGVAVAQGMDGRSTHIDARGELVHGRWFLDLDVFHKGFARARDEEGWTHVDSRGQPAYARRFAMVEPFYNGQARVEGLDGSLQILDEAGRTVSVLREARPREFAALSADLVGFWKTDTLAAAVELGVVETLPATAADVAARCGLPEERARRLLRALGELGVADRTADGRWRATSRGEYLKLGHPLTLADAALEYAGPLRRRFRDLPAALRSTSWRPDDVFAEVAADPARRAAHHRMLRSYALHDYAPGVPQLPLENAGVVLDAGGGTGALATLLLQQRRDLRVVVLDLPEIVAQIPPGGPPGIGGDLFAPWPVEADVVLLARVLHDWDDPDAVQILTHARAALRPGGHVLILELLLDEEHHGGGLCDLHLLTVTGGKERTRHDFARLLSAAGLRLDRVEATPALPHLLVGIPSG